MSKEKLKTEAKEFAAFLTEIATVMQKHKVNDMLCVFPMNGKVRNSYIPLGGEEQPLYCNISDGIDAWLRQVQGFEKAINN